MVFGNCTLKQRNLQFIQQPEGVLPFTTFLMDRTTDAVFCVAPDAKLVYVNEAACCLVGYSREKLLSLTLHEIDPNFSPNVCSEYWKAIEQQGSLYFESLYQTQEGWSFPVEITITYLNYYGKEYGCLSIRDITKRKQLEVALQRANETLEREIKERTPQLRNTNDQLCCESVDTAKPTAPQSIFPSSPKLREVFHFIEANYHQSITLSDVAEAVGYSPAYLTDLVRRQTGKTVNRWIVERRIVQACSLLRETNQSVDGIAEAVGYQNAGHFFRQFRQYRGTTPQAWRNSQRTESIAQ